MGPVEDGRYGRGPLAGAGSAAPSGALPDQEAAAAGVKRLRRTNGTPLRLAAAFAGAMVWLGFSASPALADLRLCNKTQSTVSVAIGYKGKDGWRTEGWWNIPGDSCGTLLPGSLGSRYYYLYAVDSERGGEWGGKSFMCTRRKMFTILGIEDCVARGYERTGFFEIDTAEQRSWTIHLYQPTREGNGAR